MLGWLGVISRKPESVCFDSWACSLGLLFHRLVCLGLICKRPQDLKYIFKHCISGHPNRVGTRKDIRVQGEHVNEL